MDARLLRFAYVVEFLLALIAVFALWSQVGGQNHLDLMPWYWKLLVGIATALCSAKATGVALESERPWNARTWKWLGLTLMLLVTAGILTYYYHLNEPQDQEQEPESTPAAWNITCTFGRRCGRKASRTR